MQPSGPITRIEESRTARGWSFRCELSDGRLTTVRLDWADYDYWCPSGNVTPDRIAEAVITTMIDHGQRFPESFDAARVRHVIPTADELIQALTGK